MPLLDFWKSAPQTVEQLTIEQVVSSAGDGALNDGSKCSQELREYLAQIPSSKLSEYIEFCLSTPFNKGGMVLQDLVNELGRRLEYNVENGLYQGNTKSIGFDGIWSSPAPKNEPQFEPHTIIIEVKTTDAYRVSLETIMGYRRKLFESGKIKGSASCLIVVGRQDTGELEAQVRGSQHAWDIRLISADALIKLVQLKEKTEDNETGLKIQRLLIPMEYTRLDKMIDVMFTAAKDVEEATANADASNLPSTDFGELTSTTTGAEKGVWHFTDAFQLEKKRDQIVFSLSKQSGKSYIKKSPAMFWDTSHEYRFVCTISKRYTKANSNPYWFAFQPNWKRFLSDGQEANFVLGCMDLDFAFVLPLPVILSSLDGLYTTSQKNGEVYWHIQIAEPTQGQFALLLPKKNQKIDMSDYRLDLLKQEDLGVL